MSDMGILSAADEINSRPIGKKSTCLNCDDLKQKLDYRIGLKPAGNYILTPLEIPDFKELSSGSTKNKETVDFTIMKVKQEEADSLLIEVLDGSNVVYSTTDTASLLAAGGDWQWDGYDSSGVLDTRVLKSKNLKIRTTASKGGEQQKSELDFSNKAKEVEWVDVKIDRNAKTVEITVRPSFSDGGIEGDPIPNYTARTFEQLKALAKSGIEQYWSRNGNGIGQNINTIHGTYTVGVVADLKSEPKASNFKLIESLKTEYMRSTSIPMLRCIVHNAGYFTNRDMASQRYMIIAAHEFGHLILNAYAPDGSQFPEHSSTHKGSSTYGQTPVDGNPQPTIGEVDLMKYYTGSPSSPPARTVASESDVQGLLWLTRIQFRN